MKVLDLFSGTGGWSAAFLDRGHDVLRIDNDEQFMHVPWTSIEDVMTFRPRDEYDVVLASPPCQAFSLAATGTHMWAKSRCRDCQVVLVKHHERWIESDFLGEGPRIGHDHRPGRVWLEPKTDFGKLSVRLVERTLELVDLLKPTYWWMENPNGGMIHFVPNSIPRVQVTYCQYGESRQKLTNLWGQWPGSFSIDPKASKGKARDIYTNRTGAGWVPRPRCENGASCHTASHRGDKTGTQGISGARDRAIVPYALSLEVCLAVERAV